MLTAYDRAIDGPLVSHFRSRGWWSGETVTDLLDEQASRTPHSLAFEDGRHRFTWAGLADVSRELANAMRGAGVGRGTVIALLGGWESEFMVIHHAAARAGAVTLPLPSTLRPADLGQLIAESDADWLVVPSGQHVGRSGQTTYYLELARAAVSGNDARILTYDIVNDPQLVLPHRLGSSVDTGELRPDDDYVMSPTAGTTGRPKLSLRCHESWLAMGRNRVARFQDVLDAQDARQLCLANLAQGVGYINGIIVPLLHPGMGTHLLRGGFDPSTTLRTVEDKRPKVIVGLPIHFTRMAQAPEWMHADLSSVDLLLSGGAGFPRSLREQVEDRFEAPLVVAFGASDIGLVSSTSVHDPPDKRMGTVGRPVTNTDIKLRKGVGGIDGGYQVGIRGPDLVSAFYGTTPSVPVRDADGYAWLDDIVTVDDEGYLDVVDRPGAIIVRGGQNISELAMESHLIANPSIALAAVVGTPNEELGQASHAFVVPRDPASFDVEHLRQSLRESGVSSHHIPDFVTIVPDLPVAPGGKVDKELLRRQARREIDHRADH